MCFVFLQETGKSGFCSVCFKWLRTLPLLPLLKGLTWSRGASAVIASWLHPTACLTSLQQLCLYRHVFSQSHSVTLSCSKDRNKLSNECRVSHTFIYLWRAMLILWLIFYFWSCGPPLLSPSLTYKHIMCSQYIDFTWVDRPSILTAAEVNLATHFSIS